MRKMVAPVIWLIVLSFVIWGVQSAFLGFQKESQGVGRAFGELISFKEFQDAERSSELLSSRGEEKRTIEEIEAAAWQHIVLGMEAGHEKMEVTDREVLDEIKSMFGMTELDRAAYAAWVQRNFGEQPRAFEERVRKILRIRKLVEAHRITSPSAADEEVSQFYFNENNKLSIEYARFPSAEKAEAFKSKTKTVEVWETAKKDDKNAKIVSLGPISLQILMAAVGISKTDASHLVNLEKNMFSDILPTKKEYTIFRVIDKQLVSPDSFTDTVKEEYKTRLIEQKKQAAFFEWWNGVFERAKVEKFGNAVNSG